MAIKDSQPEAISLKVTCHSDDIPAIACDCWMNRSLWVDIPDPKRAGWIRTTCNQCGKWLGNRPALEESGNEEDERQGKKKVSRGKARS